MSYFNHMPVMPLIGNPASQRGSALIVALVFLLAMTLIGVTAMQGTSQQETMASNARQRNLAFQAAEAALRSGERLVQAPPTLDDNGCLFTTPQPMATDSGTFWMDYDWSGCQAAAGLAEVAAQPQYAVEDMGIVALQLEGGSQKLGSPLPEVNMYRVTSRGQGATTDAVVILQSLYKRPL